MTMPPFAYSVPTDVLGQWVLRILAVAGAAAVGGLVAGLVTQGLSRLTTTRPVPRVPLQIVRLLGAIVCGWVAVLLLFTGPGGGGGGAGWWPFGTGGTGTGKAGPAVTARQGDTGREATPRDSGKAPAADGRALEIEVLPEYPALYQVRTPDGPRKFKFEELTAYLLEQKKATPPVKAVRIQTSDEGSDPNAPAVTRLVDWANHNGLVADTSRRPEGGR